MSKCWKGFRNHIDQGETEVQSIWGIAYDGEERLHLSHSSALTGADLCRVGILHSLLEKEGTNQLQFAIVSHHHLGQQSHYRVSQEIQG